MLYKIRYVLQDECPELGYYSGCGDYTEKESDEDNKNEKRSTFSDFEIFELYGIF